MSKTKKSRLDGKPRVWKFTESQVSLLMSQAERHRQELAIIQAYQQKDQLTLLTQFTNELGIGQLKLKADLAQLAFVEQEEAQKS